MGRKLAIIGIFLCSAAAWAILGGSIVSRTNEAGSDLSPRVASTWGAPQNQTPPAATVRRTIEKPAENPSAGAPKSLAETIVEPGHGQAPRSESLNVCGKHAHP